MRSDSRGHFHYLLPFGLLVLSTEDVVLGQQERVRVQAGFQKQPFIGARNNLGQSHPTSLLMAMKGVKRRNRNHYNEQHWHLAPITLHAQFISLFS